MNGFAERALLGAKWVAYFGLCGGDYGRYSRLRSAAVRALARRTLCERKNVRFLQTWVRQGDTAVDVGANFGAYSIGMARAVGATGRVLAFEPLRETFTCLRRNVERMPRVSCFEIALSNGVAESCEIAVPLLFGRIPEPSLAGLGVRAAKVERRTVRLAMLDDYLEQLDRLTFIKVDVEGHELAFLEGARKAIAAHRPLIQFESNDIAADYGKFREFAASLGYCIRGLDDSGKLRVVDSASGAAGNNFYLAPEESAATKARGPE
jgi:FkbM family methyltransferase